MENETTKKDTNGEEPKVDSQLAGSVLVVCTKTGCPRRIKVPFENTMPVGTATISLACPWHTNYGGFSSEKYFDTNGKELFNE